MKISYGIRIVKQVNQFEPLEITVSAEKDIGAYPIEIQHTALEELTSKVDNLATKQLEENYKALKGVK